ncbi:MAG: hypothetical protein CML86_07485 [Rhodobiaceae bacterium]|nr:hypothetical protein [Rhodobiaceae bacterium]|tara:strand:- start:945 stop:1205 length:261 start_codon:yes stop_codon:yes gene_type:complete
MCGGGGGSRPAPPPPPPPISASQRAQRAADRRKQLREKAELKEERYQDTLAEVSGRRGRRSLMSGRRSGSGYLAVQGTVSRGTLGV